MLFKRYLCGLYIQPPSLGVLCTDLPIVELGAATKDTTRASTKDSIARREDIALQQSAKQHETVCCQPPTVFWTRPLLLDLIGYTVAVNCYNNSSKVKKNYLYFVFRVIRKGESHNRYLLLL
jgi:hypothetical protein